MRLFGRGKGDDARAILPIASAGHGELLVGDADRPVWPVASDADRLGLSSIARTFGSTLNEAEDARPAPSIPGDSLVFGVGDTSGAAELYAHLTQRSWTTGSLADLTAGAQLPEVVVVCGPALDRGLVEWLMLLPHGGRLPGVIWGRTRDELRLVVLTRSAAAYLNGPTPTIARIDIIPGSPTGLVTTKHKAMLGSAASPEELHEWIERQTGLLAFHAHGSPTSLMLQRDHALCALHGARPGADRHRAPHCITDGYCIPAGALVREAIRTQLFDPDVISARIVAVCSCQAVSVGSPALSPDWSYFPDLTANPSVGAVLGSAELGTLSYFRMSHDLLTPLEHGATVGNAIEHFEQFRDTARLRHRLLLFGDPRTRASPDGDGGVRAGEWREPERWLDPPDDIDVDVLRSLAKDHRTDHPASFETPVVLDEAVDTVMRFRERGDVKLLRKAEHQARLAALDHIRTLKGRTLINHRLAECTRDVAPHPCPSCGWSLQPYIWTAPNGRRTSLYCPYCQDILDMPHGATVDLELDLPTIRVHGELPTEDWDAALYIVPARNRDVIIHRWPAEPDGSPVRAFGVRSSTWPRGQLNFRFVLFHRLSMHSIARIGMRPVADGSHAGTRRSAKSKGRSRQRSGR